MNLDEFELEVIESKGWLPDDWQRLIRIYAQCRNQGPQPALPFMPYFGPELEAGACYPRVAIVGKATSAWGPEIDFPKPSGTLPSMTRREEWAIPSAFWQYVVEVTRRLAGNIAPSEPEKCRNWALDRVAWLNVAKIGASSGNPSGQLLKLQEPFLAEILRRELRKARPTHVVVVTGSFLGQVIRQVFGQDQAWEVWNDDAWYQDSSEFGCHVCWTRHPQGWRQEDRDWVIRKFVKVSK